MATEQAFPAGSAIAIGGGKVITSPFQFVADQDTFLRVVSTCSVTGVSLSIQGRRLDEVGQIQPIVDTHTPLSTRVTKTQDYVLGVGAILNLTVFAAQGTPLVGQCYVMVQLLRNFGGTAIVLGTLLGGYVTRTQALGFPGSPIVSSTEGEPAVRFVLGTTPGAGNEINETVPAGARWELLWFICRFTADGTVATRTPRLTVVSGGKSSMILVVASGITAGQAFFLNWGEGENFNSSFGGITMAAPFPTNNRLLAATQIQMSTIGLVAGDVYDLVSYQVREWLEV